MILPIKMPNKSGEYKCEFKFMIKGEEIGSRFELNFVAFEEENS